MINRALVTGATGLIGSTLVRELLKQGVQVIAAGRSKEKLEKVFGNELRTYHLTCKEVDLLHELPSDLGDLGVIYHAASPISGNEIDNAPLSVIDANLIGTKNCMEYLSNQKDKGKIIIFSSATVYANYDNGDRLFSEDETEFSCKLDNKRAAYSESKRMIEVLARAYYIQRGVEPIIARMSYVYGYTPNMPDTAMYEFIGRALRSENILLNSVGSPRRDNIHVSDVVRALILLAEKGEVCEAYNVSSGFDLDSYRAIDEIAEMIADCANRFFDRNSVKVIRPQTAGVRSPGYALNNEKLRTLGWSPQKGLLDGIRETMEWYVKDGRQWF